jgi:hypothetical protein
MNDHGGNAMNRISRRDAGKARLLGLATAASGTGLMAAPRVSLQVMGADDPEPAPVLFRIIGMFMTVSGGILASGTDSTTVMRWSVIQKAAASTAVTGGVAFGHFHPRALALAAFDAASAVALARMLRRR